MTNQWDSYCDMLFDTLNDMSHAIQSSMALLKNGTYTPEAAQKDFGKYKRLMVDLGVLDDMELFTKLEEIENFLHKRNFAVLEGGAQ